MYEKYYGLSRNPFGLSPDPSLLFASSMHKEGLATLHYGVTDRKGFLLLTGDVGTGKTTLLQVLLHSMDKKVHVCLMANPKIDRDEFYFFLCEKFGLSKYSGNKSQFVIEFAGFLESCHQKDERVVLIVDEAHVLPVDILEEIRLLSNQEYSVYGVMSVFLVGQPELNERLEDKRLLPLRQRIGTRFHLIPFSREDTQRYILFRLQKAGATKFDFFTDSAIKAIFDYTKGVPRLINIVCDRAMLIGFAESNSTIDSHVIEKCIQELYQGNQQALSKPQKKSCSKHYETKALTLLVLVTICLFFMLIGQIYYVCSNPAWPGYEQIGNAHNFVIKKGETLWEQFSRP